MDTNLPHTLPPVPVEGVPDPPTPLRACDAHLHVIGPSQLYPLSPERAYTCPDAPVEAALSMLDRLGMARAVFVQCHVHGTDNRAMLDAISRAPERLRGVAVVNPDTPSTEIGKLRERGVRALRFHHLPGRSGYNSFGVDAFRRLAPAIADSGMHAHFMCDADHLDPILEAARTWTFPIVIDHYGSIEASAGSDQSAVRRLANLLSEGRVWLKASAPYRLTRDRLTLAPLDPVAPIHAALVRANPEQILWGSDWPHTRLLDGMPHDLDLLRALWDWTCSPADTIRILVENPERLFFS